MATYVPNAAKATEPPDSEKAKTAAAEFREIKKYITKLPIVSVSASKTLDATDAGKTQFHPASDTTARAWTIPSNASVPYDIGTLLHFAVQHGAGAVTLSVATDTMRLLPAGTTAAITLAPNSRGTAQKITATEWQFSGIGVS